MSTVRLSFRHHFFIDCGILSRQQQRVNIKVERQEGMDGGWLSGVALLASPATPFNQPPLPPSLMDRQTD